MDGFEGEGVVLEALSACVCHACQTSNRQCHTHKRMRISTTRSSLLLLFLSLCPPQALSRTFVDDRGMEFTWPDDASTDPKIAVRAGVGGVSLYHMGLRSEQLTAIWGLWSIRGSSFDPLQPTVPSNYPQFDPTPDETAFLQSAINLSPSCWQNPRGCFRWDNVTDLSNLQDEIDFVIIIDNGSSGATQGDNGVRAAEDNGMRVIFVDTFFEPNEDCRLGNFTFLDESQCFGRSMIDIVARVEELAIFLGVEPAAELQAQKLEACTAAEEFTAAMQTVSERGIQVKVSILGTRLNEETGNTEGTIRDFDPIQLWVPRTLEELGMPLLHAEAGAGNSTNYLTSEYFVDCPEPSGDCETLFPVDFWLIDSRSFLLIDDTLKTIIPDKVCHLH